MRGAKIAFTDTPGRALALALVAVLACPPAPTWSQMCMPPPYVYPLEWGDAPEGQQAYPDLGIAGLFPTCFAGPSGCMQHAQIMGGPPNNAFFGPNLDYENDGNGGVCPPPQYENDECDFPADGDAGLTKPTPYTLGPTGPPFSAVTCGAPGAPQSLGTTCGRAVWGTDIDIMVTNNLHVIDGFPQPVYLNVLVDLDRDGAWSPFPVGPVCAAQVPEHVVRNLVVPSGFSGLASMLPNAPFDIGPDSGYVWVRFTISPDPVQFPWDGSGFFEGGETEDYLLHVSGDGPAEYGDAPENTVAYPPFPIQGRFPTCVQSPGYVVHPAVGTVYFGSGVDFEFDGNANDCAFNVFDNDECFGGEAGLVVPRPYTIERTFPGFAIVPCAPPASDLGTECASIQWGTDLDLQITNTLPSPVFFNMLADWSHSGTWDATLTNVCGTRSFSEHVVHNLVVPSGFSGLLSQLSPPARVMGSHGYVWTRFTVSSAPAPPGWDGSGNMGDGETEDYLLHVAHSDASDTEATRPSGLRIGEAAPNPTFAVTRVDLELPLAGNLAVEVFDAKGRRVRDIGSRAVARGAYRVVWDGLDAAGKRPAAGVYFLRLTVDGQVVTRRVLLLN